MNEPVARPLGLLGRSQAAFRQETGGSLLAWAAIALLQFATQVVFRRHLDPGDFATLNTLLGVLGLLVVPIFALSHALSHFHPADSERLLILQKGRLPLILSAVLIWSVLGTMLLWPILEVLRFPRFSLGSFMVPSLLFALGLFVSGALYENQNRVLFWSRLLVAAAAVRLLASIWLTSSMPWAEAGLVAGWFGGLVALTPLLRQKKIEIGWKRARAVWADHEFRHLFFATCSVTLGIFLFSSADRLVAQAWFGRSDDNNMGLVRWGLFDGYQTAGLIGRSLLWGTQPLLVLLAAERVRQAHTPATARNLFWIYLASLILGAVLMTWLTQPLSRLFGGADPDATAYFIPPFAIAMMPIGLLQGVGFFALASRRYIECFVLGGSSLVFALFLFLYGRPQLLLDCVFGGGLVALMLVLFVGVVRWGRRQP
jgi:hypothetical protein